MEVTHEGSSCSFLLYFSLQNFHNELMGNSRIKSKNGFYYFSLYIFIILCIFAAIIFLAEFGTRMSGRFYDFREVNQLRKDPQRQSEPGLWTYIPNREWISTRTEYSQKLRVNEDGTPWPPLEKKQPGETLVLALGDSLTHGIGDIDGDGGGFPAALQRNWNYKKSGNYARVINAGVAGSDPVFSLWLMDKRLLRLNPDVILFVITSNDIENLIQRHGFEGRLGSDGYLAKSIPPWWASFFNASHLV